MGRGPTASRAAGALAALAACTHSPVVKTVPFQAPAGARAFGLEFGREPGEVARALRAAGIPGMRLDESDEDTWVADRCPAAPLEAPCRLSFGPRGLYAAEVRRPAPSPADVEAVRAALERELGPGRAPEPAGAEDEPALAALWERSDWTVTLARGAPEAAGPVVIRAEYEPAAPPVVAAVPLYGRRELVEALLAGRGAVLLQRDAESSTWLACPGGAPEAVSCVVEFRQGRAAALTEVYPRAEGDDEAMAEWRRRSARLEIAIGRPPSVSCPDRGPERVGGDCTASWHGERLTVVVGAHRNAGGRHRGGISVYTTWAYPLLVSAGAPPEPGEPQGRGPRD